jgi:hypothetical protein
MSRQNNRRNKKKRKRAQEQAQAGGAPPRRIVAYTVEIERLELAAGHDGLLRGHPEPVLVVGLYRVSEAGCSLLGRTMVRFAPKGAYPSTALPLGAASIAGRMDSAPESRLVLIGLALEEDSGGDVKDAYAMLDRAGALLVWSDAEFTPSPVSIRALGNRSSGVASVPQLHVLLDGIDMRDVCLDDDWIGASALVLPAAGGGQHRLCFRSADGLNDWTAIVRSRAS